MEKKSKCDDLIGFVMDPQNILPEMSAEKVKILLMELDMIMDDYERDIAIMYLSSNYSSKKHLCSTILNGKHDHEIKDTAQTVRNILVREINLRKMK